MSEAKDEQLVQFQSITGIEDVERARFYLESSNWQLDLAISSFYENDGSEEAASSSSVPPPPPRAAAAAAAGAAPEAMEADEHEEEDDEEDDDDDFRQLLKVEKEKKKSSRRAQIGNINYLRNDESSDDDEEQGQAFFAGGSRTSGQQILGPPKKKGQDLVSEMFKRAREQGAEVAEPGGGGGKGGSSKKVFTGAGFTLGSSESDSQMVAGPSTSSSSSSRNSEPPREFTLKMWQNGFSLDDGELRPYDDPRNREFLLSITKGRIPLELIKEARGGEVHVNMEDHKTEDYVRPKATVKPFQGSGHVLGSVVPPIVESESKTDDEKKSTEQEAGEQVQIDESQPTTTLQVRLSDGSRLVVKLNQSHTLADLRRYITLARPEYATRAFGLVTTFPNKELTDDSVTLSDAGLLGAAILLRLK